MAISGEGDRGAARIGPLLITVAAVAGWIWLGLALIYVLKTSDAASLGPGMAALDRFSALGDLPAESALHSPPCARLRPAACGRRQVSPLTLPCGRRWCSP